MNFIANRMRGFTLWALLLVSAGLSAASSRAASQFNLLDAANDHFLVTLNAQLGQPEQAPVPSVTINGTQFPATGYQGGALVTGLDGARQVLYAPWQVQGSGGTIASGVPHGVALAYDAAVQGFGAGANFNWFDLNSQNGIRFNGPAGCSAQAYNFILVVGHTAYYCPAAVNQKPVFVAYDFQHDATAQQSFLDPASYSYWPAPAPGGKLGRGYGWCGMAYDGRFIYYAPTVSNGNAVRYDTAKAFTDSTAWSAFNMTAVNAHAYGFNSISYDGHRYIYYPPNGDTFLVKFDTWNGGSNQDPAAFANPGAYTVMDLTQLGAAGYPVWTGGGAQPADPKYLRGFNGGQVVFNQAGSAQYMYLIPWTFQTLDVDNKLHLNSTFARVRIGNVSGGVWQAVDPFTDAGGWQLYDLSNLTNCPNWTGPKTHAVSGLQQSVLAGYQLSWVNTSAAPRVGFCASAAAWWSQHAVDADLYDPAGWYIAPVSPAEGTWVFGGAYDPVHDIFYGSSPFGGDGIPLIQTAFGGAGAPPSIVTQPSNATVNAGQAAAFSVTAAGGQPLLYQWMKNGAAIPGATNDAYTTPATAAGDNGAVFSVKISNIAGSATSSGAMLTVVPANRPPAIVSPATATPNPAAINQVVSFTAAASDPDGDALVYSWSFGDGATATATGPGSSTTHAYTQGLTYAVTVIVTDGKGGTVSSSTGVTVSANPGNLPVITSPGTAAGTIGARFSYAIAATNNPTSFNATSLPAGLTVNHATGVISGTPAASGVFNATLLAINPAGLGSAALTIAIKAAPPLTVKALSGKASFVTPNRDALTLSGVMPSLAAPFDPSGQALTLIAGGATVAFTLDGNGRGKSAQGAASLKFRPSRRDPHTHKLVFLGGDVAFSIRLKNGTWADAWGLKPASAGQTMMTVALQLGENFYSSDAVITLSGNSHGSNFKK